MIDLLVTAVVFLAGLGLGRPSARLIGLEAVNSSERPVFELAIGWAGLSMILFGLGLLGFLQNEWVWGIVLSLALLSVWSQRDWMRSCTRSLFTPPSLGLLEWLVLVLAFILLFFILLLAMAPPTGLGMGWDGLMYHLPTIQTFVDHGRIVPIPYLPFSNYAMGMNILFVPGLMLGRPEVAQLIHFSMGFLAAVAIGLLGARYGNREVALLAPILFLITPLVQSEATWPMNDLGIVLYTCLALFALLNWQETQHTSWLVYAGIMAGFAFSIKATAAFAVAALSLIFLVLLLAKRSSYSTHWLSPLLAFGIPLLLFGAPWYIKNYVMVGNPFLPFFYSIFGGDNWSFEAAERYRMSQVGRGVQIPFFALLVVWGMGLVTIGYFTLKTRYPPVVKIISSYTVLYLFFWLASVSPQRRYLLPIYPTAILLMTWFMVILVRRSVLLQPVLYTIVALGLIVSLVKTIESKRDMLAVGLGLERREDFISRKFYIYQAYRFANTQLPTTAKLFIFPETRTYYLNRPYIWGAPIAQDMIDYADHNTSSSLMNALRNLGITHVLISQPAYVFLHQWQSHDPQLMAYMENAFELVDGLRPLGMREVFEANGVTIYVLPETTLDKKNVLLKSK